MSELEDRLRGALTQEADEVRPAHRLDDIRAAVSPSTRRRWLPPLAAAAAVAVIAVGAWIALRPTAGPPPVPATPSTTMPVVPAPTPTPSDPATGSTTTAITAPGPTVDVAVPVYYVAPPGRSDGRYGLVRTLASVQAAPDADVAWATKAALIRAVQVPDPNPNTFVDPWPDQTVGAVTVEADHISIDLAEPGRSGLDPAVQRLAVQQLVWTATAAAKLDVPVYITVVGGRDLFDSVPGHRFQRPAPDQAYQELASVWVDSPSAGQTLPAASPVTITGQACTFEANVRYELRRGGAVVKQGTTTASSGCPQQGSWTVVLGTLPAGSYTFRAIDISQKDGSVAFQDTVPFSVG